METEKIDRQYNTNAIICVGGLNTPLKLCKKDLYMYKLYEKCSVGKSMRERYRDNVFNFEPMFFNNLRIELGR